MMAGVSAAAVGAVIVTLGHPALVFFDPDRGTFGRVTVIAHEDHDGLLGQLQRVQLCHHAPHAFVDGGDHRRIRPPRHRQTPVTLGKLLVGLLGVVHPAVLRMPAGQQQCPRRTANRMGISLRKPHAVFCQAVHRGRVEVFRSITTGVERALVVGVEDHHVGARVRLGTKMMRVGRLQNDHGEQRSESLENFASAHRGGLSVVGYASA